MQSAGYVNNANISDMADLLDHADSDGLTFSDEQEEMHVECSSAVNVRPRHGGTRWHESDLEGQASSWTTVAVWR